MKRKERLLELIQTKALNKDGKFQLAYGGRSEFFFDIKKIALDPEGSNLISEEILEIIKDTNIKGVGGLESGAIPIVAGVTEKSWQIGHPVNGFFVRKKAKNRGTKQLIEGNFQENTEVVLVDDVTTTGNSVVKAVEAVRERGSIVKTVITVVDRLNGAKENLGKHQIELKPLYTRDDFRI